MVHESNISGCQLPDSSEARFWKAVVKGNSGEQLCLMARCLRFYGDGISFQVVFGQSFWLRVFPGGTRIAQLRWMPARRIMGGGWTHSVTFWPFPNSSGWWWLISSMFFTRTSCYKTTCANGYCSAWPGRVVSLSVLTLTYVPGTSL